MEDNKTSQSKKRQTWKHDEVSYMLMLMDKYNLNWQTMDITQIAQCLLEPMAQMHFYRTVYQISMKLKSLKKRYVSQQEKQDVPLEVNSPDEASSSSPLIAKNSFKDLCIWSHEEIRKMLDTIKELKLENEITLTFFSPIALRLIATSLQTAGFPRNINQVNQILMTFKSAYIDYKVAVENGENPKKCEYYLYLEQFWAQDFAKCRLSGGKCNNERNDFWSKNETAILFSAIEELEIEEPFKNTLPTAYKLQKVLEESGFNKSAVQIMNHFNYLKQSFLNGTLINSGDEAVQKFNFYHRYKHIFEHCFVADATEPCRVEIIGHHANDIMGGKNDLEINVEEKKLNNDITQKTKRDRGMLWSTEEICILLDCVRDLHLEPELKNRCSSKIVAKLVKPLGSFGYHRTDAQIKHKLKSLKRFYLQCYQKNNSVVVECPFYNKLHNIFRNHISESKLASIQKLLPPDITVSIKSGRFCDHSYTLRFDDKPKKGNEHSEDKNISGIINLYQKPEISIKEETITSTSTYEDDTVLTSETEISYNEANFKSVGNIKLVPFDLLCLKRKANTDNIQLEPFSKKTKSILQSSLNENKLDFDNNKGANTVETIKLFLSNLLENQRMLQEQHHKWMEDQFEMQRKHDRVQRAALLNEIKEFSRELVILNQDYFEDTFEEI